MERIDMAVFLVKVLEDQPSEVFHYPGARISDLLVVNQHSVGWYHGVVFVMARSVNVKFFLT
jgi:hypothetical protein